MEQANVSLLIAGEAHLPGGGAVRVHRSFSEPPCVPRLTDVPGPPIHTDRPPFPPTPPCTHCVTARHMLLALRLVRKPRMPGGIRPTSFAHPNCPLPNTIGLLVSLHRPSLPPRVSPGRDSPFRAKSGQANLVLPTHGNHIIGCGGAIRTGCAASVPSDAAVPLPPNIAVRSVHVSVWRLIVVTMLTAGAVFVRRCKATGDAYFGPIGHGI